jgi:hypothetical protein
MIQPGESKEEYTERIDKYNRERWICLGEVEQEVFSQRFSCFECSDSPNNYLFINKETEHYFIYAISPSYYKVGFMNPIYVDKETSVIDFLQGEVTDSYIFCERNYPGNRDKFKIKLKGMNDWIYPRTFVSL